MKTVGNKTWLTIVAVLFTFISYSQNDEKRVDPIIQSRKALGDSINYLAAISTLKKDQENYGLDEATLQASLTCNAFILNNKSYYNLLDSLCKDRDIKLAKPFQEKDLNEVISRIIQEVASRQVVMINENHWFSNQRFLVNCLLDDFYTLGFRYLAIEAIWESSDSLNNRGYPIQSTGYYTLDPRMANLVRNALERGFTIVSYDEFSRNREFDQAQNIFKKTLAVDSTCKVLVYAGGEHISKSSVRKKMAYHFEQLARVEPFVIQQQFSCGIAKSNISALSVTESSNDSYDLVVLNNIGEDNFQIKPRSPFKEVALADIVNPTLIHSTELDTLSLAVYVEREYKQHHLRAIPVDLYLVNKQLEKRTIKLPYGSYVVVIRNCKGEVVHEENRTI